MSYLAQMQITQDHFMISRITACAASLGISNPHVWVMNNIWEISAAPDWAARYAEAEPFDEFADPASWVPSVGRNPNIITDAMILAEVSRIIEAAPKTGETT